MSGLEKLGEDRLFVPKSVQDWIAQIRRNNKSFEKASPAKKRVMLAKDVLAAIAGRRYVARRGQYLPSLSRYAPQQPAVMIWEADDCWVCAKGALFVSKLDRLNGVRFGEVGETDPSKHLLDMFSQLQLDLIESAFEQSHYTRDLSGYLVECHPTYSPEASSLDSLGLSKLTAKAARYCRSGNAGQRLKAIMLNIIANNGTFDPSGQRKPKTLKKVAKTVKAKAGTAK